MSTHDASAVPPPEVGEANLSRTYVLVVVVEILVIAALYWLGRHFS